MKKSDDEIQTLSEKELKLIDNVVQLTSTTEEENIFHQGFYSGYKTCEKEDYKKGSENFIMGVEWVEEKINSITDMDIKIQAEIESVGEYLNGSPYQKTYEDGFIKGIEWFKSLIKNKL
ncbi:MAG: hypothetical protein ACK5OW_01515 [bacterium]|jgi:hypothetical protein